MGSGKSSVGRRLAQMLGAEFSDLDELIVARESRTIPEIFAESGEEGFRKAEYEALKAWLDSCAGGRKVLALGGGTVTYAPSRELLFSTCPHTVYLRVSLDVIRRRLGEADASRPLYAKAPELYASREPLYAMAAHTLDCDNIGIDDAAQAIIGMLGLYL